MSFTDMVQQAVKIANREAIAEPGQCVVITAGVPFGTPGATNVLRIAWVDR
jgi:pyruvate kinase